MKKRFGIKSLAVFMAILIALTSLPLACFGVNFSENTEPQYEAIKSSGKEKEVFEILELRDENSKQFKQKDGTVVVAQYDDPVHYRDESGEWQDIDNTLSESFGEYGTPNARIKFAKKITGNKSMFTLHEGSRKITMSLDNAKKKTEGVVTNTSTDFDSETTELQKMMTLDKLSSKILYADILDGVDLEYVLNSNNVKENIIVKSAKAEYKYTFTLKLNNLDAELTADGDVHIFDPETKEVIYTVPAGYMYDANGEYSDSVYFSLEEKKNGDHTFTVTADAQWINNEEREFPITIDPTVSVANSTVTDLYVSQNYPTNNYNIDNALYVGNGCRTYWKTASQVPTPLPDHAYIISASLTMYAGNSNNNIVTAHQVTSYWDDTLTWNKTVASSPQGSISNTILDYNRTDKTVIGNVVMYTWDITSLVKNWYAGTPNYGICFKTSQDTATSTWFYSKDQSTFGDYRPRFTFVYKDMKGLEPYWSYTSQSVGSAGTGYVNNATGNLVFTKSMLSTTDSLMSYTPTFTYNSSLARIRYKYPNVQTSYWGSYMPYGFKMSMNETLIKKSYIAPNNDSKHYYTWTDADATEHYFFPIGSSTTMYEDEDGLQLRLEVSTDECTITDDSKTVKKFTKLPRNAGDDVYEGWYLSEITDKNNNKISFTFDSGKRPITVSLTPNGSTKIDFLQIKYNSDTFPYLIYNEASKEAIVFRYSAAPAGAMVTSGCAFLREVIYAHGNTNTTYTDWQNYYESGTLNNITFDAKMSYLYDDNGYLTKAKDEMSGYEVRYTYSGSKVSYIQEYGNGNSVGQKVSFDYYIKYTSIRNSGSDDIYGNVDDITTISTFDNEGRTVSTYAKDHTSKLLGATSGQYETEDKIKNNIKSTASVSGSAGNYLLNGSFESENFQYWTKTANVSSGSSLTPNSGKHSASFNVKSNVTDQIYQYTNLKCGDNTLSMLVSATQCNNVRMYVTAQSLSDSTRTFTEEVPLNKYSASGSVASFSMHFSAISFNSTGSEPFKITIKVVGGSSVSENAYITVDNMMLEIGIGNSEYNLVQAGNFEHFHINSSGIDVTSLNSFWQNENGNYDSYIETNPFGKIARVNSTGYTESYLKQTIYTAEPADLFAYSQGGYFESFHKTYIMSGFAKSYGQYMSPDSHFRLKAVVKYFTGYNSEPIIQETLVDFVKDSYNWQFACKSFDVYSDSCPVESIEIYCEFSNHPGAFAYFDEISVIESTEESIVKYEYYGQDIPGDNKIYSTNLDGLVRKKTAGYYEEYYEYNDNRMLTRKANNRGEIYDYTYASNGVDLQTEVYYKSSSKNYPYLAATPDSIITKTPQTRTRYTYNNYGQCISTETDEVQYNAQGRIMTKPDTLLFTASKTYYTESGSRIFGAVKSETDSLGIRTLYQYNSKNGRLIAVTNTSSESGICYTYDAIGNVVSVRPATYHEVADSYNAITDAEGVYYTYTSSNRLQNIATNSTMYNFTYDNFGNTKSISAGNHTLASYEYYPNNGKLKKINYGNGFSVRYVYDILENVKEIWYSNNGGTEQKAYEYTYTSYGQLHRYDDLITNKSIIYRYDTAGKLTDYVEFDSDEMVNKFSYSVTYDSEGRPNNIYNAFDYVSNTGIHNREVHYTATYNTDSSLHKYRIRSGSVDGNITYDYDTYKRLSKKEYIQNGFGIKTEYSYTENKNTGKASSQIHEYKSTINGTSVAYEYTYDDNGYITNIQRSDGIEFSYLYDDIGQLVRENNGELGYTYTYTYDKAGNVTEKKTFAFTAENVTPTNAIATKTYTYGDPTWGDLLTYCGAIPLYYDEIGNPITYFGGNSLYSFTWVNGRQLAQARFNNKTIDYEYNDQGIRTSKTVDGVRHDYYLNGTKVIADRWGTNLLVYLYDAEGTPIGMQYRQDSYAEGVFTTFWFEKNLQGDIVAIYNNQGTKVLKYNYDAWGNVTTTYYSAVPADVVADYNCLKYRGYYYDSETGFYYVSSRYYDPEIGRWINADSVIAGVGGSIQGYNMFAYCFNNPVNMSDSSGHWPQWMKDAANWVNNNIIQPVVNFFSPSTNTISGQFQDGIFRGSGSLTGGYSEFNWRLDDKIKSSGSQDGWVGGFGKASVGNANGKIGIGNDNLSASLKGVGDGLVATAQAGLHYKDGFGIGAKAKASVLSGRATTEFNIFGWQVELGVSGELLSIGAEATIGIFPTDDGGKKFDIAYGASPGLFGWGFVARVKVPG